MATRFPLMLMAATTLATTVAMPGEASARHRPPAFFPAPIVAPGSVWLLPRDVYYARPAGVEVYFTGGWWWSPWEGGWYRSAAVDGPWEPVPFALVPRVVVGYPGQVHRYLPRAEVIPFAPWRAAGYGPGWRQHRDRDDRWGRDGRRDRDRGRDRPAPRDRDDRWGRDGRGGHGRPDGRLGGDGRGPRGRDDGRGAGGRMGHGDRGGHGDRPGRGR